MAAKNWVKLLLSICSMETLIWGRQAHYPDKSRLNQCTVHAPGNRSSGYWGLLWPYTAQTQCPSWQTLWKLVFATGTATAMCYAQSNKLYAPKRRDMHDFSRLD